MDILAALGIAIVLFATTNVDDIFILVSFFADKRVSARGFMVTPFVPIAIGLFVLHENGSFGLPSLWFS